MRNGFPYFVAFIEIVILVYCAIALELQPDREKAFRVSSVWTMFSQHFPRFSRLVAAWGWAALLGGALALEEAHEYGVAMQPATARPQPSALVQLPEAGKNWNTDRTTFGPPEVPPQGLFEDPALKKEAELAALPRSALASRVTETTRKMRVFDRGWLYEGPPAPDAPPTTTGEGEDYKNEMAFYNERMKEWHAEKDRSLQKFRNLFQQQFAAEMFVLNELVNRFQEVRSSSECQAVFSGTFYNGQLSGCADYLDKIVREKLD